MKLKLVEDWRKAWRWFSVNAMVLAAAPGKLDATAESGTVGAGTGEINLDDVAKQTVELGRDFDAANIRIVELQSLIRKYENACKVN